MEHFVVYPDIYIVPFSKCPLILKNMNLFRSILAKSLTFLNFLDLLIKCVLKQLSLCRFSGNLSCRLINSLTPSQPEVIFRQISLVLSPRFLCNVITFCIHLCVC